MGKIPIRTNGMVVVTSGHWSLKSKDVKDDTFNDFESIF